MSPTPECYRAKGLMAMEMAAGELASGNATAELGLESWNKRAWVNVPALAA
jgi:hypothetical protein